MNQRSFVLNCRTRVASLFTVWPRCSTRLRPALLLTGVAGVAYVAFMFLVDVPMYWSRWLQDEASGRHYLSLQQGLLDVSARWVVSHQWQVWKTEVAWMSLYFSVAVWLSIALIHTPTMERQANKLSSGAGTGRQLRAQTP